MLSRITEVQVSDARNDDQGTEAGQIKNLITFCIM